MTDQYVAKSTADMPNREDLVSMSGFEQIDAIRKGEMAGAPIAGLMNFHMHSVERGCVSFRGAPRFEHLNPMGGVHGGWYGTILDSALGCAVATIVPKGSVYTTLEYKVNLTRALKPGIEVECTATVQHAGRTTAVAEATLRGIDDGKLYATGSTTCIIMTP